MNEQSAEHGAGVPNWVRDGWEKAADDGAGDVAALLADWLDRFEARIQATAYWRDGHYVNSNGSLLTDFRERRTDLLDALAPLIAAERQQAAVDALAPIAAVLDERVTASLGLADWAADGEVAGYARVNPDWLRAIVAEARAVRAGTEE